VVANPTNWGALGTRFLGWELDEPLKHDHPHICQHAQFGRSVLKGVCIIRGELQNLWSAGTPLIAKGLG